MSDQTSFGFGKFVPGFDFLQNIAKGSSQGMPQMPHLSSWVAPTLNVEEVEKRISELKAVLFWLDQNAKALGATIQALEVQKMTLATLRGMNVSMGELTEALKVRATAPSARAAAAPKAEAPAPAAAEPAPAPQPAASKESTGNGRDGTAAAAGGAVDPLQWWSSLTQQFQQIATQAMLEAGQKAADGAAAAKSARGSRAAAKTASASPAAAPASAGAAAPARKARSTGARKTSSSRSAPRKRSAG